MVHIGYVYLVSYGFFSILRVFSEDWKNLGSISAFATHISKLNWHHKRCQLIEIFIKTINLMFKFNKFKLKFYKKLNDLSWVQGWLIVSMVHIGFVYLASYGFFSILCVFSEDWKNLGRISAFPTHISKLNRQHKRCQIENFCLSGTHLKIKPAA